MEYYPVQKRYGDETYDLREFITPNSLTVLEVAENMDNSSKESFVQSSWNWVHQNIKFPYFTKSTEEISDRHYSENYIQANNAPKMLRNAFISGTLSGLARLVMSGTIAGGAITLLRDAVIGHGLYSMAMSAINGEHNRLVPALSYETLDFWNFSAETLRDGIGDCEDTSILLCSILRNKLSEDEVYVSAGRFKGYGHAWVTVINSNGKPITLETTGSNVIKLDSSLMEGQPYEPIIRFNDKNVIGIQNINNSILNKRHNIKEREKIDSLSSYYGINRKFFEY